MYTPTIQSCSALVHKFEVNVCSILNSSETESPTHSHIHDNDEVKKEEEKNEMIVSSDISTSNKEQIETTMGNKILKTKSKMTNFTELTDHQIEFLVSSTKFSAQQVREWHES
jgi:predicted DNA binding protein